MSRIIVVGGGHAGCEAAASSARIGVETILVSSDVNALARMSCNPAIGGIAKGHLVREIDALGGVMPIVTDRTAIQYRVLNRSKGFAVWSPRTQCDRALYSQEMVKVMSAYPNVVLLPGTAVDLTVVDGKVTGVVLDDGTRLTADAVVLTCGTFLNGLLHFGEEHHTGGRFNEPAVTGLTEALVRLGFQSGRLKTGTPPRLIGSTIDFSRTERQDSDDDPIFFSRSTTGYHQPQLPCWITQTNEESHNEIRKGLDRSPLYTGMIQSTGPRYCPSIETKIFRFADKGSHTLFLEPEGLDCKEYYPNGFSTSLPLDIQISALHKVPGLEHVELSRSGYAIEYDYFQPYQLHRTLETKLVSHLYFAGQINGTSGYEEAAAQGLVAGANAAMQVLGKDNRLKLERDQAYIGVMIDDLITSGTEEPYRMFTSRAEFRLKLRLDNAYARLTEIAFSLGLVGSSFVQSIIIEEARLQEIIAILKTLNIPGDDGVGVSAYNMLKRPDVQLKDLVPLNGALVLTIPELAKLSGEFIRRIESEIKYEGYIKRESHRAADLTKNRSRMIPQSFDYNIVAGLSSEAREKLSRFRPDSIGEALNLAGITPSDIAVLLVYMKRYEHSPAPIIGG